MTKETTEDTASIAGRVLAAGNPLDNDQLILAMIEGIAAANTGRQAQEALRTMFQPYFQNMLTLAASALSQREEPEELGLKVNLIDVFGAWGEREARDTAMLIDLCLGAALEQLVPFTAESRAWPVEVTIEAAAMERLAGSGRIVRQEMEPNRWSVRLEEPGDEGGARNEKWGDLGWVRRHIQAFADHHDYCETMADATDGPKTSVEFHRERRKLGYSLLALLDAPAKSS